MSGSETWQFFLAELSSDKKFWLLGMFTTLGISWHLSDPWMDSPPFPLASESPHVPCNPFVTSLGLQIHPHTTVKSSHLIDVSYHNFHTLVSKKFMAQCSSGHNGSWLSYQIKCTRHLSVCLTLDACISEVGERVNKYNRKYKAQAKWRCSYTME